MRDFWRGEPSTLGEFAARISGSADLYQHSGRAPMASINFITVHDGFTLNDLVSYNNKHNEANGEGNADGESNNRSWNCGEEGPTEDPEVLSLRSRQIKNFLTTMFFSQGVPMICHGDEMGRTQAGNNNVYCQDNELSWVNWNLNATQQDLLHFTRKVIKLRKDHPVLRRRRFFYGDAAHGGESKLQEIGWLRPSGEHMRDEDWTAWYARSLMVYVNGHAISEPNLHGEKIVDKSFLLLVNASEEDIEFTIPTEPTGSSKAWKVVIDTQPTKGLPRKLKPKAKVEVESHSLCLLMN